MLLLLSPLATPSLGFFQGFKGACEIEIKNVSCPTSWSRPWSKIWEECRSSTKRWQKSYSTSDARAESKLNKQLLCCFLVKQAQRILPESTCQQRLLDHQALLRALPSGPWKPAIRSKLLVATKWFLRSLFSIWLFVLQINRPLTKSPSSLIFYWRLHKQDMPTTPWNTAGLQAHAEHPQTQTRLLALPKQKAEASHSYILCISWVLSLFWRRGWYQSLLIASRVL